MEDQENTIQQDYKIEKSEDISIESLYYEKPVLGTSEVSRILEAKYEIKLSPDMVRYYINDFLDILPDCREDQKGRGATRKGNLKMSSKDIEVLVSIYRLKKEYNYNNDQIKAVITKSEDSMPPEVNSFDQFKALLANEDVQRFLTTLIERTSKVTVEELKKEQERFSISSNEKLEANSQQTKDLLDKIELLTEELKLLREEKTKKVKNSWWPFVKKSKEES